MNVIEVIKRANADSADADSKGKAAIDANASAKDAADKAAGSVAIEAAVLARTGEVHVKEPDGTVTAYDAPDGKTVRPRVLPDAANLPVPEGVPGLTDTPAPAPAPAPETGGNPPDVPADAPVLASGPTL